MPAAPKHVPPPRPPVRGRHRSLLKLSTRLPTDTHYVLAGGGAHGCVQWGSLQALAETDLVPSNIIGTSAGAMTGAIVAEDPISSVHRLAYLWSQLDLQSVVGDGWLGIVRSITSRRSAIAQGSAVGDSLSSIFRARDFNELELPFAAVATDLASGHAKAFDRGELIPALLASSAIPGVLPPVSIGGRPFIDGLVSANLPATLAIERGAQAMVILDTGSRAPVPVATSPAKVVSRVNNILAASQRSDQLLAAAGQVPVLLIPTPDDLGGTLDFRGTIAASARSYELGQAFLADLVRQYRRSLRPGLYARDSSISATSPLRQNLRPVNP